MPAAAPAVLALHSPGRLPFSFAEELATGQWRQSRDTLHLPNAGAAGPHRLSFLHQTASVGGKSGIRSTEREAQPL